MAVALALLAACAFAMGNALQQKGTLEAPADEDDPRFLLQILHRPVWLAGGAMQLAGWVLQAAALARGSLVVVQSVTSLSIVLVLPLGVRFTNQVVTRRVWFGALAMLAGVVFFLTVGSPAGGNQTPAAEEWWSAGMSTLLLVGLLGGFGRRRRGAAKALLFGSAAGVCFAFQAAVTKVFVPLVGDGLHAMLTSWTIYVLILSALIGFVLQQSALKTGVLAPATASSNAVTLFASVVLGVTVFGETLAQGGGRLAPALLGLGTSLAGMIALAGASAPTSQPESSSTGGRRRVGAGGRSSPKG